MRLSRVPAAAIVAGLTPVLLLGTAAPGSAAGATMTKWKASMAFDGAVRASLTAGGSSTLLQDYAGDSYYDRALALPGRAEPLTVNGATCASGPAYVGQVSIYGAVPSWSHIIVGTGIGGNVQISCKTSDGLQHKLTWGARLLSGGAWDSSGTTQCVQLTRTSGELFSVVVPADGNCKAQDAVVDAQMRFVKPAVEVDLAFTATLTVPGLTA